MNARNRYRTIGKTGLSVFERGFGAWAIGGSHAGWGYGPTNDEVSVDAVREALSAGCNFFDTADCYGNGHSENLLGKSVSGVRKQVFLATKVGYDFYHGIQRQNYEPSYLSFALNQSLRRLGTDYIDLYQLHNPPPAILFNPDIINALMNFKKEGKVRHIGASLSTVLDGAAAVNADWLETVQVPYNMLYPEAETLVMPTAVERGIGIIAREPLANGFLTGKYGMLSRFPHHDIRGLWSRQRIGEIVNAVERIKPYRRNGETMAQLAMRFVLESKAVSVVVCGCKTPLQARENFSAFVAGKRQ